MSGGGKVPNRVRGPAPQAIRRPATGTAPLPRAHHFSAETAIRRRLEHIGARIAPSSHTDAGRTRVQIKTTTKSARRFDELRDKIEGNLLHISAALFFIGALGWCWLIFNEFHSSGFVSQASAALGKTDYGVGDLDPFNPSTYARGSGPLVKNRSGANLGGESPASIVAQEWSRLQPRIAERSRTPAKQLAALPAKQVAVVKEPKELKRILKPQVQLASLEDTLPPNAIPPSRIPSNIGALTSMVDFETAPFPYHGTMPGSERPFLNAGEAGHRGHVNFRGHVLWEDQTFSDDRVLLHIPPGFDPRKPAMMVVFFHGHGANLARDVRDRQRVPTQLTAAGANAVLVAPQFAVDAADSSAGKFWEPNGFKRFLDEAAFKLARLYGDPATAATFARMPIVIVAYSGGFGPTLYVLDRGGVRSRIRGIVLLDALYAGIDRFADWIADNRSAFFVSSYTPHTAHHNADLERLLRERSVPYGSELRRGRLDGMVTFLPAGDVSHRDFVTHAWADNPIKDILVRMDDIDPHIETATVGGSLSSGGMGFH
jgi:hypothetical protein